MGRYSRKIRIIARCMEKNEMVAGGWRFGWSIPRSTGGTHRARIISIDSVSAGSKTVVAKKWGMYKI